MITEEWLFDRSIPEPNTGCWLWLKSYKVNGYAKYNGIPVGRRFFGLTDPEQLALHHCDQPACVNPEHLYVGTRKQNNDDAVRRGRWGGPVGHSHHASKLTPEDVIAIRNDPRQQKVIAAEYGVVKAAIWAVKARRSWKHLP
jgi:hypothetical protein